MGNQTSETESQYQRMGQDQQQQPASPNQQSGGNNAAPAASRPRRKSQQVGVENALDTLQSMFMTMDREVLRLVLMEQCQGNLSTAVEALLAMQSSKAASGGTHASSSGSKQQAQDPNEVVLYDGEMRPITLSASFLQPPSHFLQSEYGLSSSQVDRIVGAQAEAVQTVQSESRSGRVSQQIYLDQAILKQWSNLLVKYKFGNAARMDAMCKRECASLKGCGSLIRVIFMMRLYHRLCNESGDVMNKQCAETMHEYLAKGFLEYSLIQLINDCNHLMQYHEMGGEHAKNLPVDQRNKAENEMRNFFGFCDVMNCRIIQRVLMRQDNDDNKNKKTDIDVERDIVDKYHRVFYHSFN